MWFLHPWHVDTRDTETKHRTAHSLNIVPPPKANSNKVKNPDVKVMNYKSSMVMEYWDNGSRRQYQSLLGNQEELEYSHMAHLGTSRH